MNELLLETSIGAFSFVGQLHADRPRAALLALSGAFPPPGHMHEWVQRFSGVSVLVGKLETLQDRDLHGLQPLREGIDLLLDRLFPDCPVVTLAASTGCLFTLGLKSRRIAHHVAVEPFFSTAALWPFFPFARKMLADNRSSPGVGILLREVFGITDEGVTNRDYGDLLARLSTPTDVVVGTAPLEPERDLPTWPSFTSAEDRMRLARNPAVTVHAGPPGSGHALELLPEGKKVIEHVTLAALNRAASARQGGTGRPLRGEEAS